MVLWVSVLVCFCMVIVVKMVSRFFGVMVLLCGLGWGMRWCLVGWKG